MVKSRRAVQPKDGQKSCANCRFLRHREGGFLCCGIDGEMPATAGLITMFICRHYKEAKADGKL